MRALSLAVAVAVLLAACSTDLKGTRLELQTESGARTGGCDLATLAPVEIAREGTAMAFVDGTGARVAVIWPFGFTAWLEYDVAVLYAPDGSVVGREGRVLDNIGGSADAAGFHVCKVGLRTYS